MLNITIGKAKTVQKGTAVVKPKKRLEFSQKVVIASWFLMSLAVIASIGGEFVLQYLGRGSMESVTGIVLALISFIVSFVNAGYFTQNIIRNCSLNKYNMWIDEDGCKQHIKSVG